MNSQLDNQNIKNILIPKIPLAIRNTIRTETRKHNLSNINSLLSDGYLADPTNFYKYEYCAPDKLMTSNIPPIATNSYQLDGINYNLSNLKELYETFNPEYLTIRDLCDKSPDKKIRLDFYKPLVQTLSKNLILFLASRIYPSAVFGISNKNIRRFKEKTVNFRKINAELNTTSRFNNINSPLTIKYINRTNRKILEKTLDARFEKALELLIKLENIIADGYVYYSFDKVNIFEVLLDYVSL